MAHVLIYIKEKGKMKVTLEKEKENDLADRID